MMNGGFTQILATILAALLVWAAVVDLRTRTIPDWLSIAVAAMAPLFWWATGIAFYPDAVERICGALLIFAVFFGMFWMGGMGGGDVKLGTAIGLWFAPLATLLFFVVTSFAGGFVSIGAWIYHHKIRRLGGKTEVPYGVAIAFGGLWLLAQRFLNQFAGMSLGN
jgi:prepilin peptidase CpaA